MKNKYIYIILALGFFLLIMIAFKPLDKVIEERYKTVFYQSLILILLAIFFKIRFKSFQGAKMKKFAFYMFILLASSGLGMIIKCAFSGEITFLGLINIVVSLAFLILSSSRIGLSK